MRLLNMENNSPLNSQLSVEIDWQFLDKCVVRCTVKAATQKDQNGVSRPIIA